MENRKIYLASPHMSEEGYEQQYIKEAFDTNWLSTVGPNLEAFEADVIQKTGAKAAVALASGTAAIHMALKSLGVHRDDKVICQSLTFAGTCNPIAYQAAKPIFIDSEPDTWNMSPEALERALAENPDAKAVIPVHLYGTPAKLTELRQVCSRYQVPILEDAAESLGSKYKGAYTGTFGDIGILSFNGNKIITTSGGGMILFNDEKLSDAQEKAAKVRFWATQARDPARYYQHSEIGYNYRMSNIIAGVGRGQLKVLDRRVAQKQALYAFYKEELGILQGVTLMPLPAAAECNCWLTCMVLDETAPVKPLDILLALEKENIEARPIWKPMHLQPVFADCAYYDNGGCAQSLFENGVCLPSGTNMIEDDWIRIVKIITKLWASA